jgi:FkbM family methyltransferase
VSLRLVVVILRLCIVIIGAAAVLCLLMIFFPPVRGALFFALGRASTCTFRQAVMSPHETGVFCALFRRIESTSRMVRRDRDGFELWHTESGNWWIARGGRIDLLNELEEQVSRIYGDERLGVQHGDVVLDCGAHWGFFSRTALDAGARLVVAIEPAPENLVCLKRNLAPEIAEGRVIVYPKGVWDKADVLRFYLDRHRSAADSFVFRKKDAETLNHIPVTTIDKLVEELRLDQVDFIKMDIEGAERRAIIGAKETLVKWKPRMALSVYHLKDDAVVIPKLVTQTMPRYQIQCGRCTDWGYWIRADVVHFF